MGARSAAATEGHCAGLQIGDDQWSQLEREAKAGRGGRAEAESRGVSPAERGPNDNVFFEAR